VPVGEPVEPQFNSLIEENGVLDVPIRRWSDGAVLCTLKNQFMPPIDFQASRDGEVLALRSENQARWTDKIGKDPAWRVYRADGTLIHSFPREKVHFALAPDGMSAVFGDLKTASVVALTPHAPLGGIEFEDLREVQKVFYDLCGQPKVFAFETHAQSHRAEVWDLLSGRCDWSMTGPSECYHADMQSNTTWVGILSERNEKVGLYSLIDGSLYRAIQVTNKANRRWPIFLPGISQCGQFAIISENRQGLFTGITRGDNSSSWMDPITAWLDRNLLQFGPSTESTLMDVRTGARWQIPRTIRIIRCSIDGDFRLIDCQADGVVEYDSDSLSRRFVYAAVALLGVSIFLSWIVWGRRYPAARRFAAG
jgi:hypothetical protein